MTPIIAGRFEQEAQAEAAVAALRHGGFDAADVTVFFVNPAGQHTTYLIGGDRDASPGAKHAHGGALKGAAVGTTVGVGLAASPVLGPAAVVAGAGVGAYAGSLVGALGKMEEKPATAKPDEHVVARVVTSDAPTDTARVRSSGIFVAVRAVDFAKRVAAVNALGAKGAQDIERADGTWQAGRWIDFDPLKPPLLVDLPAPEDVQLRK
jgi:hypothetical protein